MKIKRVPKNKFVAYKSYEFFTLDKIGSISYGMLVNPNVSISNFTIKSIQIYAQGYGFNPKDDYKKGVREIVCEITDDDLFDKFWEAYNKKTEYVENLTNAENRYFDNNAIWINIRLTLEEYENIVWDTGIYWLENNYYINGYLLDSSFNPYIEEAIAKIEQGEYNK